MSINSIKKLTEEDGVVFLIYASFLTQTLISSIAEVLVKEAESNGLESSSLNGVYVVMIELAQNMMNYARKREQLNQTGFKPEGLIWVGRDQNTINYYVQSRNLITRQDKDLIQPKLDEISKLDEEAIKARYRELRRSGLYAHDKGGGIGFYEVAKRAQSISYAFEETDSGQYYFDFRADIAVKR